MDAKLIDFSEICQEKSSEIGWFLLIVSWRSSLPLPHASKKNFPWNRPIFLRIFSWKSREIFFSAKYQKPWLTHYLLARLKHYKDHWACILKTIFACKSFIYVRSFVFFHVANGVEINTTVIISSGVYLLYVVLPSLIFSSYTCNN